MKKSIILYALFCLFPICAYAHTLKADYAVNIGIFNAAKLSVRYTIDTQSYALETNVATNSLFHALYPFSARYAASGRFVQGALQTADYHYQTQSRAHRRMKRLIFDENGFLIARESNKDSQTKRVLVEPPTANVNAFDLQSVFAFLNRQIGLFHKCNAELFVYDGKKNFRVNAHDEGTEPLEINPDLELMRCSLYIQSLDDGEDDLLWKNTKDQPMMFWIAFEPKTKTPYITQIQIASTPLGQLSARLENLTVED